MELPFKTTMAFWVFIGVHLGKLPYGFGLFGVALRVAGLLLGITSAPVSVVAVRGVPQGDR